LREYTIDITTTYNTTVGPLVYDITGAARYGRAVAANSILAASGYCTVATYESCCGTACNKIAVTTRYCAPFSSWCNAILLSACDNAEAGISINCVALASADEAVISTNGITSTGGGAIATTPYV
jgi:hypothetical protein